MLTVHSDKDESQITTLALKYRDDFYIFTEDESKKGLKNLLIKLGAMSFNEVE